MFFPNSSLPSSFNLWILSKSSIESYNLVCSEYSENNIFKFLSNDNVIFIHLSPSFSFLNLKAFIGEFKVVVK